MRYQLLRGQWAQSWALSWEDSPAGEGAPVQWAEPGLELSWTSFIFAAKVLFKSLTDLFVLVLIHDPFLIMCEGQALETGPNLQLASLLNLNLTTGSAFVLVWDTYSWLTLECVYFSSHFLLILLSGREKGFQIA